LDGLWGGRAAALPAEVREQAFFGPVHLAYNPSYLTCFFSWNSIFLSKKSANSVFQPVYNSSRTVLQFEMAGFRPDRSIFTTGDTAWDVGSLLLVSTDRSRVQIRAA
jgi:hypothetical protein